MTYPQIIGLNGVARAGKDTVAQILHDIYGYTVIEEDGASGFSVMLNKALIALNPMVDLGATTSVRTGQTLWLAKRYADLIAERGYEEAKEIPEVRRLLQAMGTEVGRNLLGQNIWVDALFRSLMGEKVVITNVRFPNEYDAVKERGGEVWRIDRPGFTPANDHISDRALDAYSFDARFFNDGTVHDLAKKVMHRMDGVNA